MDTHFINKYYTQGNETDKIIFLNAEMHYTLSWCERQTPKPWALVTVPGWPIKAAGKKSWYHVMVPNCEVGTRDAATLRKAQTKKLLSAFTDIVERIWSDGQNSI